MSVTEMKEQILQKIEKETDATVLNAVLEVLDKTNTSSVSDTQAIYDIAKEKFGHTLKKLAE